MRILPAARRAPLLAALALTVAAPVALAGPASAAPKAGAPSPALAVVSKDRGSSEVSRSVTRSMVGVRPSAYIGKYYDARYEGVRKCIVKRESEGYYRVVNRSSGAAGAYQFMRRTGAYVARKMGRPDLAGRPANTWTRFEQDKAFWVLWNHGHGRSHWAGGRWHC